METKERKLRAQKGARQLAFYTTQIRQTEIEIVIERVQKSLIKKVCK